MSKLEELIEELCPDGVEFKSLNDIAENCDNQRKPVTSGKRVTGEYPYYGASGIVDYVSDYIFDGDYLLVSEDGANLLARTTSIAFSIHGKNWVNNHAHILKFDSFVTQKFVEYYIESLDLVPYISGAAQPKLNQKNLNKIPIPFPPLEVQSEIVRILDNFTELTAELTTELAARKKQYEYYYNTLFMMDANVPMKKLGDVCIVQAGGTPSRGKHEYWDGGTIKWLGSTVCQNKKTVETVTEYITEYGLQKSSTKLMKKNTTLIALVGATIGKIAYLPFDATINQNIAGVYPKNTEEINPDYVFYACKTLYPQFLGLTQGKLAMANLSFVRGLEIPIPSIVEQNRMVEILERFDKLCNDISTGLPAEIEARKKQYEYYRDKLLTFKASENK